MSAQAQIEMIMCQTNAYPTHNISFTVRKDSQFFTKN